MTWIIYEDRSPAEIIAAWEPAHVAIVALLDENPDRFVADAALFFGVSLLRAGVVREAAAQARVDVWAAARDHLARLRSAGAGRAGTA